MPNNPNRRGFKYTTGDATGKQLAIAVPDDYRVLHIASAADIDTDWNVANPSHPTLYVHSETTPATDYMSFSHDGTAGTISVAGGTLALNGVTTLGLQIGGTEEITLSASALYPTTNDGTQLGIANTNMWADLFLASGAVVNFNNGDMTLTHSANVLEVDGGSVRWKDDQNIIVGTSNDVAIMWDTTDANANEMVIDMPAGSGTNVPVIVIGTLASGIDLGLYNGIVDPKVALLASGAVTTGPTLEFRKARGTITAPTVVTSGDDIGQIMAYGAVAAGEYVQAASIEFDMAGTIGTTRGPGTITFKTATDAAPSVLTTALTISAAQVATFASTVTVQGASATIGIAGTTTGSLILAGATSNTVTVKAQDAAGSVTFLLPAAVGSNGEQLTTNGGTPATMSWASAASSREFKNILGSLSDRAEEALARVLSRDVYEFRYRKDAKMSTGDFDTTYHGIVADEYPEVMHYDGRIFNPINAFGELMLAVKALAKRIDNMEASPA